MRHPDDLLADHVDGTLPERERAAVDAHLETCARCREEIELARGAVVALHDLEDVPVPVGVTGRVIAEARSETPKKTASGGLSRWIAGLAAAAVLVGVVAVALSRDDASKGSLAAENAPAGSTARTAAALEASDVPLEDQRSANYEGDDGAIVLAREVIEDFRRSAPPGPTASDAAGGAEAAAPTDAAAAPAATQTTAAFEAADKVVDAGPAIRCLEQAGLPPTSTGAEFTLRRLVQAKYNGDPAYLAVFLQGPGAGQPPDRAVVFVLSRKDCSLVNFLNVGFDAVAATGGT
jgi:hypothetical protein